MTNKKIDNHINLFEYQNRIELSSSFRGLEEFLDEIWKNREKTGYYFENESNRIEAQRFIQFIHSAKESTRIKSNKYVGVIHFENERINLLPKIFFDSKEEYSMNTVSAIQYNILWWLSYCRKIKFPNYQTSLGDSKGNFFEVLIYLFAKYTRELLNNSIYQQYEEVNNELPFIKGRLNVNEYINENVTKARWHKLNCTYDAFVIDNKFNRIIKYVTNLLFNVSTSSENKKYLREILFILDEVSEERATAEECINIKFNPIFGEFETVRDYCYLFLNNSISFDYKNDLKLFAFLLPMEYVFEDFIFGFIDKEINGVKVTPQSESKSLDEGKKFKLRPDLILEYNNKTVIADAKYKIVFSDEKDDKHGISQSDLYQMLAYAVRFKVKNIILFYPNTLNLNQKNEGMIVIKDEFAEDVKIDIKSYQLPIINEELFYSKPSKREEFKEVFEKTKENLVKKLKEIFDLKSNI